MNRIVVGIDGSDQARAALDAFYLFPDPPSRRHRPLEPRDDPVMIVRP
jgi:hypothetical protein